MTIGVDWKNVLKTVVALSVLWAGSGCSREPEQESLTAVAYNYSDEAFGKVLVNDKWAGPVLGEVEIGDTLGGGSICCVNVEANARTVRVLIQFIDGDYVVDAPIEQPWPPSGYARYLGIHVLPKRQVRLVVTAGDPWPRLDLLKARLKELKISEYTISDPDMWELGPEEYVAEDQLGGS